MPPEPLPNRCIDPPPANNLTHLRSANVCSRTDAALPMSVVPSDAVIALPLRRRAEVGREYALPTGRFPEAEFRWPLSGDEFEERSDATRTHSGQTTFPRPVTRR
jgi:hypothetical protein